MKIVDIMDIISLRTFLMLQNAVTVGSVVVLGKKIRQKPTWEISYFLLRNKGYYATFFFN